MKHFILCTALVASSVSLRAQEDTTSDEYELRGNEKYGYIITEKDEKIEGIVKLIGTAETPWVNQKKVKFIPKSDINPDKKRQRLRVYKTDDLKEYVAYEDGTEHHFRLIKYANIREGMGSDNRGAGGTFKTIKNLSSTRHMAEVLVNGKISVFRLYGYPAAFAVGEGDIERMEKETKELLENPTLIVQKEGDRAKELKVDDVKELTSDCKMVKEKLSSGGYASYDPAKEERKRSGLNKLVKEQGVDRAGNKLIVMSTEVFSDYNANCK